MFTDAVFDSNATEAIDQTATSSTSGSMSGNSTHEIQHPSESDSDNDATNNESESDSSATGRPLKTDRSNNPRNEDQPYRRKHVSDQLSTLTAQVDQLEQQLADQSQSTAPSASLAPELAHKVAHACLRSDSISEDEELQILRELMGVDSD
ncbi:regulatory protein MarR [Natrinema versiforme JCM 10478]|uniref:Regulatory protein MarR n=2 Tax=Natrinema versiforme TaxID=88724 RepID=L9XNT8_9EURY|nr:regulatory protein MarR [Natrinema versiforme JCM 10478]